MFSCGGREGQIVGMYVYLLITQVLRQLGWFSDEVVANLVSNLLTKLAPIGFLLSFTVEVAWRALISMLGSSINRVDPDRWVLRIHPGTRR